MRAQSTPTARLALPLSLALCLTTAPALADEDAPPSLNTDQPLLLDAADAQQRGEIAIDTDHAGHTGQGFANFQQDDTDSALQWSFHVEEPGEYRLSFRYALGGGNRPLRLRLGDQNLAHALDFPDTGGWTSWDDASLEAELPQGQHTLSLEQIDIRGANIDRLVIHAPGTEPPQPPLPEYTGDADETVPEFQLPDPLITQDDQPVQTPQQWTDTRRPEVLELFREHVYGRSPGEPDELSFNLIEEDPDAMDGAATLRRIEIQSRVDDREHAFELILFVPNDREGAVETFMLINNRDRQENIDHTRQNQSGFWPAEKVIDRGYAVAAFQNSDLAPDSSSRFTEGVIELFEGDAASDRAPDAWAALAAWGWGASRAMDYFQTDDDIDHEHVALLGHSRGGKASLWAGAEDQRFAMVISNNSGCGGAALSRRRVGERVSRINNRFPHWFTDNFNNYSGNENDLPIDQHMLAALIAPRIVYIASASDDLWADPRGEYQSLAHASPVYALWDHERLDPDDMPRVGETRHVGPMGYHLRPGGHNLTPWDWQRFMDMADNHWR